MAVGAAGPKPACPPRAAESRYPISRQLPDGASPSQRGSFRDFPEKFGWGGRIRTFTIHINSVVSYQLDHAPVAFE